MTAITERIDTFERRLRGLERELADLRRVAALVPDGIAPEDIARRDAPASEPALWDSVRPMRTSAPPRPAPQPVPASSAPAAHAPQAARPPAVQPPAAPRRAPRELDFSFLFGPRALAWTGGAVTLLGIVFFFVLAVERGWIGDVARVSLGAAASSAVFAAGLLLRRRFGDTYASLAAVGVGIAGAYATLLAASALYDLVPAPVALVLAAAIAACGAAVAVAWNAETIAGLGLIGALLVPVPVAFQGGLTALGTAFAAVVFAGTAGVAFRQRWRGLLVAAFVAALPQIAVLVADDDPRATTLAIVFWLLFLSAALAPAVRDGLTRVPATLLALGASFAGYAAAYLYTGRSEGLVLTGVAVTYLAVGTALYLRDRESASTLWAIGLVLGAIAAADLASGATLTIVWSAEAIALAWLARRIDEPRFQLGALGWLTLASLHGLAIEAPPKLFLLENAHPERAVPSVAALALAFAAVGFRAWAREPREENALLRGALDDLARGQAGLRRSAYGAGALLGAYGASLGVLDPTLWGSWQRGHVAVSALWSLLAVAAVLVGVLLERRTILAAGLVWTAAAIALAVGYDLPVLDTPAQSWAFALVAAACLAVAELYALLGPGDDDGLAVGAVGAGALFGGFAVHGLLAGDTEGLALLTLAALLAAATAVQLRTRRDLATALWVAALAVALVASIQLLDGTILVLAWAATAAALAVLARADERLELGALALLGLAALQALIEQAPPVDLFVAHRHPGAGAPAVALVVAATLVFIRERSLVRTPLVWAAGTLAVYAASLGILEAFEATNGGDVAAAFQRGHTAVSAVWGAIGLALLVAGLRRATPALQFAGFALFGVALAKLFLFDLAFLSSIARAFSFLAVGAVLLLGGFFVQRARVDSPL